jgi:hypothetical protein
VAWVGVDAGSNHSGGTVTIVNSFDLPTISEHDPAVSYMWDVTSLTGDGLVAFRRVGGAAGNTIVPPASSK